MGVAAAIADLDLCMPLFAVDDHEDEMRRAISRIRDLPYKRKIFGTANEWAKSAANSDEYTVLVSDNNLENMETLETVDHPEIKTNRGADAGLKLLTTYCEEEGIQPGLKVLVTQYGIDKPTEVFLKRRADKHGDKIHVVHKDEDGEHQLRELLLTFAADSQRRFVSEKFAYIRRLAVEWSIGEGALSQLFGLESEADPVWKAINEGTSSHDVEKRCDLLYRVKLNLVQAYGGADYLQEAHWLRTKIRPLGGLSPLEYVKSQSISRLEELVVIIEG